MVDCEAKRVDKRMVNRGCRVLVCNGEDFLRRLKSGSYLDESQKLDFELISGALSEVVHVYPGTT